MDGLEIIAPHHYSVAWLILAAGCIAAMIALIVVTMWLTRSLIERRAYRGRPTDTDALKAEYLRAIATLEAREREDGAQVRHCARELDFLMRGFLRRTQGIDASRIDASTLQSDPRTADVGAIIAALSPPSYSRLAAADLRAIAHRARAVVRQWS